MEIKKSGPTVFVLCQLDDRYFKGLVGKYEFDLHFVLQGKDCEAGDHIVRARSAWFGTRSISAEVDLDAGIYEVVPKIVATRDADAPEVQDVVKKVAEKNPQKLRQIGMNYDIANARGASELTEVEKKQKEQKKKDAAENKKKKEDEEAKEKADFEAWKKEEKAEYEAWKNEKNEKARLAKEPPKDESTKTDSTPATTPATTETAESKEEVSSPATVAEEKSEAKAEAPKPSEDDRAEPKTSPGDTKDEALKIPGGDNHPDHTTGAPHPSAPPSMVDGPGPYRPIYGRSVYGDVPPPPPPPGDKAQADNEPKTWNAVCVLGLRVYSQDPDVSIKLVKPKDQEEGAILDVDGDTPAGATM